MSGVGDMKFEGWAVKTISGTWTVENFSKMYESKCSTIKSHFVRSKKPDNFGFRVYIEKPVLSNLAIFYIIVECGNPTSLLVRVSLHVETSDCLKLLHYDRNWKTLAAMEKDRVNKTDWQNSSIEKEVLFEQLKSNDTIIVHARVSYSVSANAAKICEFPRHTISDSYSEGLADDLKNLLKSGKHSDFKIIVEDREIPVHKSVLAARSPVFSAMFEHETLEKTSGCVKIDELKHESVEAMLDFVYFGKCIDLNTSLAMDLLIFADKYNINGLEKYSSDFLIDHLYVNNVVDILLRAELLDIKPLKQKALSYIVDNFRKINCEHLTSLTQRPSLYPQLFMLMQRSPKGSI